MEEDEAQILEELEFIRSLTSSDFVALAAITETRHMADCGRPSWTHALGSLNNRYQHMIIKTGQGLAGLVLRLGRWVELDAAKTYENQSGGDCPIILAEQLRAAAVFPLVTRQTSTIIGLLYIGKRKTDRYEQEELRLVKESLQPLATLMEKRTADKVK
ncbi:GAF domain-containing protein [Paenibacillus sp. N3.4]|uniref:GAF domain-containing protein n=1 Tax=Paenibacillus sp. N3.4 TaxID=2603222 RepID=UPI0011C77297|nr:GAF domain-containing protein [Paenibacillus sp. N3.4]TXK74125.1 GAF domain-containing protein [Paenibacillus sp. N3.4]